MCKYGPKYLIILCWDDLTFLKVLLTVNGGQQGNT